MLTVILSTIPKVQTCFEICMVFSWSHIVSHLTLHHYQISPVEDGLKSVLPDSLQIFNAISRTPTSAIIQGIPSSSSVVWRPARLASSETRLIQLGLFSLLHGRRRLLQCSRPSPVGQRAVKVDVPRVVTPQKISARENPAVETTLTVFTFL